MKMSEFSCPFCWRSSKTARGLKVHFTKHHGNHMEWDGEYPDQIQDRLPEPTQEVNLTCTECGRSYTRPEYEADSSRFCSSSCHAEWMRENQNGDSAPNWRGGICEDPRQSSDWPATRKKVLRRDSYECMRCSRDVGSKSGPKATAHVHHICPVSAGGSNELENLITLCQSCHKQVHAESESEEKVTI